MEPTLTKLINIWREKNKSSTLYLDCENGRDSSVQLLLIMSNGVDINLCKVNGTSPLHEACRNGHHCTVQRLLSNVADIN